MAWESWSSHNNCFCSLFTPSTFVRSLTATNPRMCVCKILFKEKISTRHSGCKSVKNVSLFFPSEIVGQWVLHLEHESAYQMVLLLSFLSTCVSSLKSFPAGRLLILVHMYDRHNNRKSLKSVRICVTVENSFGLKPDLTHESWKILAEKIRAKSCGKSVRRFRGRN